VPGFASTRLRTSRTRGSARSESESVRSPRSTVVSTAVCPAGASTTRRTGWITPATPIVVSVSTPLPASVSLGHQCRDGRPMRIQNTGAVRSAIASPPIVTARQGCRLSVRAQVSQMRGACHHASLRASQRGRSMLRPMMASRAGRSVVESSTATATTTRPPIPTLRVSTSGVNSKAAKPTTTVRPDVSTAPPAVKKVVTAASRRRLPRPSSSRNRVTTSSE